VLVLMALSFAPVSHVAPAREISILVGTLMGGSLLAEGGLRRRMFGGRLGRPSPQCVTVATH
jgi:hypothetical protein